MTQQQKTIQYFEENKNEPTQYKDIASAINILIPNMRRILGQGTIKGIFLRVNKGTYKLNK